MVFKAIAERAHYGKTVAFVYIEKLYKGCLIGDDRNDVLLLLAVLAAMV